MKVDVLAELEAAAKALRPMFEGRVSWDPADPVSPEWVFRWPVDLAPLTAIAIRHRVAIGVFPLGPLGPHGEVGGVRVVMGELVSVRRFKTSGSGMTLPPAGFHVELPPREPDSD